MLANERRPQRRTKAGRLVSSITYDELALYFHLPSEKACKELGVGLTILKRVCRKLGIPRWPYNRVPKAQQEGPLSVSPVHSGGSMGPAPPGRQLQQTYFQSPHGDPLPALPMQQQQQQQRYAGPAGRYTGLSSLGQQQPHHSLLPPLQQQQQQQFRGSNYSGPGFAAGSASASAFHALNLRSQHSAPPDLSRLATHPDAQPLLRQQCSAESAQTHSGNSGGSASPQLGQRGRAGPGLGGNPARARTWVGPGGAPPADSQILDWLRVLQGQQPGPQGAEAGARSGGLLGDDLLARHTFPLIQRNNHHQQEQQQQQQQQLRFGEGSGSGFRGLAGQGRREGGRLEEGAQRSSPRLKQEQQGSARAAGAAEGEEEAESAMLARVQELLHRLTGPPATAGVGAPPLAQQQQQPLPAPAPAQDELGDILRPTALSLPMLLQTAESGLASNYADALLGALLQQAVQQQQQAEQALAPPQRSLATTYSPAPQQRRSYPGYGSPGSQTPSLPAAAAAAAAFLPQHQPTAHAQQRQQQQGELDFAAEQLAALLQQAAALAGVGRRGEWAR